MPYINKKELGVKSNKTKTQSYRAYASYYSDKIWKNERMFYLQEHPLCEVCLEHDRVSSAEAVHHKIPFSRGKDREHKLKLLREPKNFMSVCSVCHKGLHQKDSEVLNELTDEEYEQIHQLKFLK